MDESKFTHEQADGLHILSGTLDERVDLSFLLKSPAPLRLDLRKLNQITSSGCRIWLNFVKAWGSRALELNACPPPFVSLLNMVPFALGMTERKENVRSILIPYSCHACNLYNEFEVTVATIRITPQEVTIPTLHCPSCNHELRMVAHSEDYFLFMTS